MVIFVKDLLIGQTLTFEAGGIKKAMLWHTSVERRAVNEKRTDKGRNDKSISADILKHGPGHLGRSLESIEQNMRKKDISDLRDDYYFYFPKEKDLNNEVGSKKPNTFYKRHLNARRTAQNEDFVQ